jgi:hypothetical protein
MRRANVQSGYDEHVAHPLGREVLDRGQGTTPRLTPPLALPQRPVLHWQNSDSHVD